jgi:hypothetical protein
VINIQILLTFDSLDHFVSNVLVGYFISAPIFALSKVPNSLNTVKTVIRIMLIVFKLLQTFKPLKKLQQS